MRLDPLKPEYIREIAEIERETFDEPWSEAMIMPELENEFSHYLVGVDEDGTVLCYGGFHNQFDEAEFENIAVRKEFRGKGLGKKLFSALIELAGSLGVKRFTLEVKTENNVAISMYEAFGFKRVGIRKRYYAGKFDALIMALDIGEE